ncbi:zinc ribbon domain-containing protein [Duganella sp. P38]|uniref:zinc ribbon domain-containing protein n=1 Tax=Duganella sp. P38 TaxID=3423949 RepID=UPI003D78F8D9
MASAAAFAISQFAVGVFCLNAANQLWGRFDFVSELVWVDIGGSYESAQMHVGNQVTSQVQSSKNVINIESMTMRVWVSEIDTVIFGKDAERQLVGMRGLPAMADELAKTLKGFGETRASIVAPSSQQDLERARNMALIGKVVAGQAAPEAVELLGAKPAAAAMATLPTCKQCGAGMEADSRFCGDCGAAAL